MNFVLKKITSAYFCFDFKIMTTFSPKIKNYMIKQLIYSLFVLFSLLHLSCSEVQKREQKQNSSKTEQQSGQIGNAQTDDRTPPNASQSDKIPAKVYRVLQYVREHGEAMPNYVGGRNFQNREGRLAKKDKTGKKIQYQEWDVNPKRGGVNRGAERLVTGSDNRAWYTNDHYRNFAEVK